MFEVTPEATKQVAEYFKEKEVSPIRIFLNEGGCGEPSLAMAVDDLKDTDESCDIDGFKYIIEKDLMEKAKPIKIDFTGMGFKVDSSIKFEAPPGGGCSACGTQSSCCE